MLSPVSLTRILVTFALLAFTPRAEAQAQPAQPGRPCADRTTVVERLERRFGEVRQAMGLNRANAVVEVFASAETGSWTILVTTANGVACMIASGDLWEQERGFILRPEKGV